MTFQFSQVFDLGYHFLLAECSIKVSEWLSAISESASDSFSLFKVAVVTANINWPKTIKHNAVNCRPPSSA